MLHAGFVKSEAIPFTELLSPKCDTPQQRIQLGKALGRSKRSYQKADLMFSQTF